MSFDAGPTPRSDFLKLRHSASVDHLSSQQRPPSGVRTRSHLFLERPRSRQVSLQSGRSPLSTTFRPEDVPPPVPPKDGPPILPPISSFWKNIGLFFRDNVPQQAEPERPPTPESPPPPQHRRGDVVCLAYNTLDDRQMRRLEGKSDHRPVIGAYALYI